MNIDNVRNELDNLYIGDRRNDWVIEKQLDDRVRFYLFTNNYKYSIDVKEDSNGGYLGCVMSKRKSRAGEDWIRGRDLPDGKLNVNTWTRILYGIIGNELEMISDYIRKTN